MEKINFIVFVRANKGQCDTSRLVISRKNSKALLAEQRNSEAIFAEGNQS